MGVKDAMNAVRNHLASGVITGVDTTNCVVEDERVFNTILMKNDDQERVAVMVGYNVMDRPKRQRSEFGGTLLIWEIRVSFFVLMWDDIDQRVASISHAYDLVDEFFQTINDYPDLGGLVMDAAIVRGDPPMVYARQQMNEYFMLNFYIEVMENID